MSTEMREEMSEECEGHGDVEESTCCKRILLLKAPFSMRMVARTMTLLRCVPSVTSEELFFEAQEQDYDVVVHENTT